MSNQPVGSDSTFRDSFLEGAARAIFVMAYASYIEEADSTDNDLDEVERNKRANLPRPGAREDWYDYTPPTPPNAYALAGELWASLYHLNGEAGPYSLALHAEAADGKPVDPEEFGRDLAMQWMGTGVSWFDDHAKFPIKIGYTEVSGFTFSDDAYAEE